MVEEPSYKLPTKKPPKKYLETLIVGFGQTDVLGFSCCYLLTFHVAINDWTETGGEYDLLQRAFRCITQYMYILGQ